MTALLAAEGPDQVINELVTTVSDAVQTVIFCSVPVFGVDFPLLVGWLAFAAVFFTIYSRGINVRGFRHAIGLSRATTPIRTRSARYRTARHWRPHVSGTVGLGNIAGVAVAITIDGPGATFWMIIVGCCRCRPRSPSAPWA